MSKILGIDLGTTFSAMAVVINGEAKIIENCVIFVAKEYPEF